MHQIHSGSPILLAYVCVVSACLYVTLLLRYAPRSCYDVENFARERTLATKGYLALLPR